MDWIRKNTEKNHWGIIDLENLQSRSHLIFAWAKVEYGFPASFSAHQTTYENLLKTRLILEMKFDLGIEIFKIKDFCRNFLHIQRVKLHRNTLSNLNKKLDKFFTLPAGLVDISTSSQVGYSTWNIQWFYVKRRSSVRKAYEQQRWGEINPTPMKTLINIDVMASS